VWLLTCAILITLGSLICATPATAQQRVADEKLLILAITSMVGRIVSPDPTALRHRPAGQKFGRAPVTSARSPESASRASGTDGVEKPRGPAALRPVGPPRLTSLLAPPSRAREGSPSR
jgi:hypothetical protein